MNVLFHVFSNAPSYCRVITSTHTVSYNVTYGLGLYWIFAWQLGYKYWVEYSTHIWPNSPPRPNANSCITCQHV